MNDPISHRASAHAERGGARPTPVAAEAGFALQRPVRFHNEVFSLRDGPYPLQRLPGTRRILMLGDSFLFGAGLPPGESLPRALERVLNTRDPDVLTEVINLARRGSSLGDQCGHFKRLLAAAGPGYRAEDVIVLVNYTDAELTPLRMHFAEDPNYAERIWSPPPAEFAMLTQLVTALREAASGIGAALTLLLFDHLRSKVAPRMRDLLQRLAGASGAGLVDLTSTFAAYPPRDLRLDDVDEHPNSLANQLAADALAGHLLRARTLPALAAAAAAATEPVGARVTRRLLRNTLLQSAAGRAPVPDNRPPATETQSTPAPATQPSQPSESGGVNAWLAAAAMLPMNTQSITYCRRLLGMRLGANALLHRSAVGEAYRRATEALAPAMLADASRAAGRFWQKVVARLRPADSKLEFALHHISTTLSACRAINSESAQLPAALAPAWADSGLQPEELGVLRRRIGELLALTSGTRAGLYESLGPWFDQAATNADIALASLQVVLQHVETLSREFELMPRLPSTDGARRDVGRGLTLITRAMVAAVAEMRLSDFAAFARQLPEDPVIHLALELCSTKAAPRSVIVNWQPVSPLRALCREGFLAAGVGRTWNVNLELPLVGEAQLSFGGELDGIEVRKFELSVANRTLSLDPALFHPHYRVTIIPSLMLVMDTVIPETSHAWDAIGACWVR